MLVRSNLKNKIQYIASITGDTGDNREFTPVVKFRKEEGGKYV